MISDQIVDRFVRNLDQTSDRIISVLIEHGWNVQDESVIYLTYSEILFDFAISIA